MTDIVSRRTLSILGLAIAVGLALVLLFVLCALVGVLLPDLQVTHAWVALFTLAPVTSPPAWFEGTFFSLIFGIFTGSIVAGVHNAVAAQGL